MSEVAVVVGGASGIGAAIADRFAADGWTVVVADLPETDVTDEDSVAGLLDGVLAEHGRLDLVVNSAGVSTLGNVVDLAADEWRRVVDVCLTGAFLVIKHAGQRLGEGGSIISLSSLNARQPGAGLAPYCAAKAGLSMLTEVAALELGAAAHPGQRHRSRPGGHAADRAGHGHPRDRGGLPREHAPGPLGHAGRDRRGRRVPRWRRVGDR